MRELTHVRATKYDVSGVKSNENNYAVCICLLNLKKHASILHAYHYARGQLGLLQRIIALADVLGRVVGTRGSATKYDVALVVAAR